MEEAEFQAILDHEDRHWWYRGRLRIVRREVEQLGLPEGARILDAGCGSGRVLDELARFGDVVGVDLSPNAVAAAWARGHSVAKARGPPVEEPISTQTCPGTSIDQWRSASASLNPPRLTYGGRASTSTAHASSTD